MEQAKLLFIQAVFMVMLSLIGYILFKTGKINKAGSKTIGNILIYVSLPCVIINAFQQERTHELIIGLFISIGLALGLLIICMVISRLCHRKDPIAAFASSFSNPGFFGLPLILASLAPGASFYIGGFIAFINIFQYTYGVYLVTKEKKYISIRKILTAPPLIAIVVGILLFLLNIKLPGLIGQAVTTLSQINTPLAMFTIGIYLAQTDILKMFKRGSNYKIAFTRLIVVPLVSILILWLIPNTYIDMKTALLIGLSCPVGSNIAVFLDMYDGDYAYGVETVIISTLLSIITIPLMVLLAQFVWAL